MEYCTNTMTPIEKAMSESVNFICYTMSYVILKNKEQEKMVKNIK